MADIEFDFTLSQSLDKGHVHIHIIFCAVNFVDHHKYVSNRHSYYGIRNISEGLCKENGLRNCYPVCNRRATRSSAASTSPAVPRSRNERVKL